MDLEIVREFTLLAETCNFQLTAERLSLSQSALSKHIHKLEEELEMDLFDRSKRSVSLNRNGQMFLEYARKICKLCDECRCSMRELREKQYKTLNIGFLTDYDHSLITGRLTIYCNDHPNIQLNIIEEPEDLIKAKLTSGECDFLFSGDSEQFSDKEFIKTPCGKDRLVLLAPKNHPLAQEKSVDLDMIAGEKIIQQSSLFAQKIINDLESEHGIKFKITASVSFSSSIMNMVREGLGIALISEGCAGQYDKYGLAKIALNQKAEADIYLIYINRTLSNEALEFAKLMTGGRIEYNEQRFQAGPLGEEPTEKT